ncbi:MAG: hypothetical protein M8364_19380 [Methylobacter sp.]|uniref:hypothetical protein n=1 Tax=Methylobacter sp. TaxID=2051955 RepID=UPI00258677E1|nr:hypothetical protein [Methylobacter sp.]MCL7423059.1 hypothetical protein [Methylobacter sp.]
MANSIAYQMINEFAARKGVGVFPLCDRKTVANQLRVRVAEPSKIFQGKSSLCGPASFLYVSATDKPHVYAKYIIDLYEQGEASIGNLRVKPGADCKNYEVEYIQEIDWIGLASLRDSTNSVFDYQAVTDQFAGITLPDHLQEWFIQGGYTQVYNRTNLVFDKNLYTLLQAHQKRQSGYAICLLIGANLLSGKPKGNVPADHWVVLNSDIQIDGCPAISWLSLGAKVDDDETVYDKKNRFQSVYLGAS